MGVLNAEQPRTDPPTLEEDLSSRIRTTRDRRAGFSGGAASALSLARDVGHDPMLCATRGFHGPFMIDPGTTGAEDIGVCTVCGVAMFVPDHQPAYEIARFHGLTP